MAEHSKIEWTDATWNPVTGCSVISPGCTHCYAMKLAGTRLAHIPSRAGLTRETKAGPVWTGEVRFNEKWLDQPLRWKRPRRIFVCAHGDLFHESVPDEWIEKVFAIMAMAPQHTFQVLTKRAERMRRWVFEPGYVHDVVYRPERHFSPALDPTLGPSGTRVAKWPDRWPGWPLPNVWLGVSAEDQQRADERIPHLLATPAAVRFLSAEPLLGPMRLDYIDHDGRRGDHLPGFYQFNALTGRNTDMARPCADVPHLDLVIAGGESGPGARPMHPDWARSLRDQCQAAGVPFFFKQWGEWTPRDQMPTQAMVSVAKTRQPWFRCGDHSSVVRLGKKAAGRLLDGREWNEMPGAPR